MAKRETREEKQARMQAEARMRQANEMRERAAKARSLRVYSEKLVWDTLANGGGDEKVLGVLWELVRSYESAADDLRKRVERLREELSAALVRLDDNRHDPFTWSNPVATTGSNIEEAHTKRKALGDAVAQLARATGWWVPQIHDTRARQRHAQLCAIEVVRPSETEHYVVRLVLDGQTLFVHDGQQALEPQPFQYVDETAAWLAAAAWFGSY